MTPVIVSSDHPETAANVQKDKFCSVRETVKQVQAAQEEEDEEEEEEDKIDDTTVENCQGRN